MTRKHLIAIAFYLFYAPLYIVRLTELFVLRLVHRLLKILKRRRDK